MLLITCALPFEAEILIQAFELKKDIEASAHVPFQIFCRLRNAADANLAPKKALAELLKRDVGLVITGPGLLNASLGSSHLFHWARKLQARLNPQAAEFLEWGIPSWRHWAWLNFGFAACLPKTIDKKDWYYFRNSPNSSAQNYELNVGDLCVASSILSPLGKGYIPEFHGTNELPKCSLFTCLKPLEQAQLKNFHASIGGPKSFQAWIFDMEAYAFAECVYRYASPQNFRVLKLISDECEISCLSPDKRQKLLDGQKENILKNIIDFSSQTQNHYSAQVFEHSFTFLKKLETTLEMTQQQKELLRQKFFAVLKVEAAFAQIFKESFEKMFKDELELIVQPGQKQQQGLGKNTKKKIWQNLMSLLQNQLEKPLKLKHHPESVYGQS